MQPRPRPPAWAIRSRRHPHPLHPTEEQRTGPLTRQRRRGNGERHSPNLPAQRSESRRAYLWDSPFGSRRAGDCFLLRRIFVGVVPCSRREPWTFLREILCHGRNQPYLKSPSLSSLRTMRSSTVSSAFRRENFASARLKIRSALAIPSFVGKMRRS